MCVREQKRQVQEKNKYDELFRKQMKKIKIKQLEIFILNDE